MHPALRTPHSAYLRRSLRKAFAVNLALLLAINALVKPAYLLGVDLGVQNLVGTETYGRYAYWFSFSFLFATVLDFGLQNYSAVSLARRPERLREQFGYTLSLKLALTALYVVVVLAAAVTIGASARDLYLLAWVVLTQVLLSGWQLLRNNVAAQGKYTVNSLLSVADKVQLLLVVGTLLLAPALSSWISIERFVILQAGALVVSIALTLAATDFHTDQRWLAWDRRELVALAKATSPYALSFLLNTLAARVDIVMLEKLVPDGLYQTGLYAAGYRLLDAVNMVSFLFATLLIPMLSTLAERGEPVRPLLYQGAQYMLVLTLGVATWGTFHAQAVTELLYREATPAWGPVLAALLWTSVGMGIMYVQGSYLLVIHRLRLINYVFVGASVLNVLLNLAMIPVLGALGAAVATAATHGAIALVQWVVADRATAAESGARPSWPLLLKLAAYAGVSAAGAWLSHGWAWPLGWAVAFQALVCGGAALAGGLLVDPGSLLHLVRTARR